MFYTFYPTFFFHMLHNKVLREPFTDWSSHGCVKDGYTSGWRQQWRGCTGLGPGWRQEADIEEDKQFDQVQQYPISFVKMWLIPFEVQNSNCMES